MRVPETIQSIKKRLERGEVTEAFLAQLKQDERVGVQKLMASYLRKREQKRKEAARLEEMWRFERMFREQGCQRIAGIDEAGRGPLAGPVVAAAVILPEDFDPTGLNDSKQLSAEERATLRKRIERHAVAIGIGIVETDFIDTYNILQATYEAMRRAVADLPVRPDQLLIDAVEVPELPIPQHAIIKGDQLSHSIAAASVIAKTVRDQWMIEQAARYPQYGFEKHMGYATPEHLAALAEWGPCPLHRRSFAPIRELVQQVERTTRSTG
ncbi:ribonuclease HII [Polycladomyces sp. WAk]|uniref:Ribonuclease HII n=1 Tax=Polycladomyces zharkentensis TaxID=2807616 RepID=A0ABS2WG05_9BACL|nr:ribonuclease HII [Polycladomyces sp. WAk]MBN2908250.1 ribonuclease HII [Polycladomyces sp. WAk]